MGKVRETGRALLARAADASLPDRVRAEIHAQQDRSELIIGWFQLFVVLLFGALYVFSPKPDLDFDLVPYALASYLVLTVIRIAWATRARLPAWSLALSVVIDMALLMVLIWSFHIKYDQPASFYLKAPTLLYVFIFIALRALRFEARYVVLAGVVAMAGWGVLILYVLHENPADSMITRDYVAYMTSNSILLGAEFDKIISILVVTLIIAYALVRAKGLLVRAVAAQSAAQELSRFFAPEVAQRIKDTDHGILAGSGEARDAAILNLDMRGFTRLAASELPDQVMALLAEYQGRMVPVIQAHGGSIDKFMGDGIMATFGAVEPSETFAADALRAVEAVMAEAADWRAWREKAGLPAPVVHAGLASGRIVFGTVGDSTRLEYTVIGDAVNLAAKLEKANKLLGTAALCDAYTWEQGQAQGYEAPARRESLKAQRIEGLADPLDVVVLSK